MVAIMEHYNDRTLWFAAGDGSGFEFLRRQTGLVWHRASRGQVCAASACQRYTYSIERASGTKLRCFVELTLLCEGSLMDCCRAINQHHDQLQRRTRPR